MMDDDPNQDAAFSAVARAAGGNLMALRLKRRDGAGDFSALCDRLRDPAVTLTMIEREWLARQLAGTPAPAGRPADAQEALLCWWFQTVEGMDRNNAIKATCAALNKRTVKDEQAVMTALRRAGGEKYNPGFGWFMNAQQYRAGSRDPWILPPALRTK